MKILLLAVAITAQNHVVNTDVTAVRDMPACRAAQAETTSFFENKDYRVVTACVEVSDYEAKWRYQPSPRFPPEGSGDMYPIDPMDPPDRLDASR